MDIVSSIRDANPLLEELYEEEDGVKKACQNVHEQFKKAYKLFADVIDENNIPYTIKGPFKTNHVRVELPSVLKSKICIASARQHGACEP